MDEVEQKVTGTLCEQYRITRLLYQRPRLNVYVGHRVSGKARTPIAGSLVAIRELDLTGLSLPIREMIQAAVFEEFVSPIVLGSPHLSPSGDRMYAEGERHYLVMHLENGKESQKTAAVTLEALVFEQRAWPVWLTQEVALAWGTQLCRMVARLHRLGTRLGDLNPCTILVDKNGVASWMPLLLVSWPPAPQFWSSSRLDPALLHLYERIFPIAESSLHHAYIAPEMIYGVCDERSDVYSLGAILYLLFTHYAPISVARRLRLKHPVASLESIEGIELIRPRLLNTRITPDIEYVLLHALELDPMQRYQSVFALVEALEASTCFGW